jgi:chemotaxis protein methyltransferase CheR
MRFDSETLGLSGNAFALLRDLIHERTGLCFDDSRADALADKLSPRVVACGFDSFLDYYYYLKYDQAAVDEWPHVADALSVPETYFWREMDQVQALVDVLVPQYFAAGGQAPLRIWSAACASGEEPLSIAIALNEAGWLARAPIEIRGTDASPAAIARARAGLYRERSFRRLPPVLRERYFTAEPGGSRIDPAIHSRVQWGIANLVDEAEIGKWAEAPIIFCRNVFIYFSTDTIRQTVDAFARHMPRPSYLFLGAAESLIRLVTRFEFREVGKAFVYVID